MKSKEMMMGINAVKPHQTSTGSTWARMADDILTFIMFGVIL